MRRTELRRYYREMMRTRTGAALIAVVSLSACQIEGTPLPEAEHGTFPYHPLVYELDLAILAYQLHGQSLVWPIDPYYEEHAGDRGTPRETMLELVRAWAATRGEAQVRDGAGPYRGPGVLAGLANNPTHDPIIYDYSRLHPWSGAIVNLEDQWTEYLTPRAITGRIRDVYVSARPIGSDTLEVAQLAPARADADADATDVLLAFEGATGDRGEEGKPASYSLMGFVLVRDTHDGGYDVHVTFRGSRSGNATRAALDALDSRDAKGNPDWVTDLAWDAVHGASGASDVTTVGAVHRGFARSMHAALPGVFQCLEKAAELRDGRAPTNIYVTGHSLGGGLAQHFSSAVLLGDAYGPAGAGPAMPDALRAWPWPQLKLVTYSAPRAGDHTWAEALSGVALDSPYYAPGPLETLDADALVVVDPIITARLHDAGRPVGLRVLASNDPITTTRLGGDGNHIGTTVYVNGTSFLDWVGVVSTAEHEPETVRAYMTDAFADDRNPAIAWRYLAVDELVPDRDADAKGTPLEMEKLAAGLRRYYAERGLWFDDAAFTRDLALRFAIERGSAE